MPVRPTSISSLIEALESITVQLEKHTDAMNYSGTDEFNVHTFARHSFDRRAHEVLHDLTQRIEAVSDDLYNAQEERQTYEGLTPTQRKSRTVEFEENAVDAQVSAKAKRDVELTAPGRCDESVKVCTRCGGLMETVAGIHRCWACFRGDQDGR